MPDASETHPGSWWQLFGRPLVAYCAASIAAGATVGLAAIPFISEMTFPEALAGGLIFGLMISAYIAVFALLPSMATLAIVKILGIRRGLTDVIAGGLIGVLMLAVIHELFSNGLRLDRNDLFEAARYGLAGLVGGFVYWRTNGRPQSQIRRGGQVETDR